MKLRKDIFLGKKIQNFSHVYNFAEQPNMTFLEGNLKLLNVMNHDTLL